jgi:signal peptidase I
VTSKWSIALLAAALAAAALARRRFLVVRVRGRSMMPTLADGDRVLVRRQRAAWSRGSLVVGHPPGAGPGVLFVKRLAALEGDRVPAGEAGATVPEGSCWVVGDAAASGDSATWGPVDVAQLIGVVIRPLRVAARPK